jgi:hypothetical protein
MELPPGDFKSVEILYFSTPYNNKQLSLCDLVNDFIVEVSGDG